MNAEQKSYALNHKVQKENRNKKTHFSIIQNINNEQTIPYIPRRRNRHFNTISHIGAEPSRAEKKSPIVASK